MYKDLIVFVVIGLSFFVAGILTSVAISGQRLVDILRDHKRQIIPLLILALALPLSLGLTLSPTSLTSQADKVNLTQIPAKTYQVSFNTSASASAYLEFKDNSTLQTTTIDPEDGYLTKTTKHIFQIPAVGEQGGEVTIYVNGEKYTGSENPFQLIPSR